MGLPLDPAMSEPTYENLREKNALWASPVPPILESHSLKIKSSFLFLEDTLGWRECEIFVTHLI